MLAFSQFFSGKQIFIEIKQTYEIITGKFWLCACLQIIKGVTFYNFNLKKYLCNFSEPIY